MARLKISVLLDLDAGSDNPVYTREIKRLSQFIDGSIEDKNVVKEHVGEQMGGVKITYFDKSVECIKRCNFGKAAMLLGISEKTVIRLGHEDGTLKNGPYAGIKFEGVWEPTDNKKYGKKARAVKIRYRNGKIRIAESLIEAQRLVQVSTSQINKLAKSGDAMKRGKHKGTRFEFVEVSVNGEQVIRGYTTDTIG